MNPMKRSRTATWHSLWMSLCFAGLVGCDKPSVVAAPPATNQAAAGAASSSISPLDQEALDAAKVLFGQHWTQCGDSWVSEASGRNSGFHLMSSEPNRQLVEIKGVAFVLDPSLVLTTAADRLNGIEWKGAITIPLTAGRTYPLLSNKVTGDVPGPWSEWWSPLSDPVRRFVYAICLMKKNGAWVPMSHQDDALVTIFDPVGDGTRCVFSPIACKDVEQHTRGNAQTDSPLSPDQYAPPHR